MVTASNEIWVGIDDQRVKLEGEELAAFLKQAELDALEKNRLEQEEADKLAKKSALLSKLGITEEDVKILLS